MDHDNRQDQALKEALKRIYEEIEIPDSTESWKRVEERLARRRSVRRWHQRLRYIAAVFVGSAVLTLAVNMKVPGAYSFAALFHSIQETVVRFYHAPLPEPVEDGRTGALTPPPDIEHGSPIVYASPNEHGGMLVIDTTLDEAKELASFPLLVPSSVPEGYELKRVRLYGNFPPSDPEAAPGKHMDHPALEAEDSVYDEYLNLVHFEYIGPEDAILQIVQQQIRGKSSALKVEMPMEAGDYREVSIRGVPGILLIPRRGSPHLEWLTADRVLIRIVGKVSEEEIIETARSMEQG